MVGVNGYRVLQAWVITFKGSIHSANMVCIEIEVHIVDLSSGQTWGNQVAVNGPNIILYLYDIMKCRGWGWQPPPPPPPPPTIELSDHELIIVIKKKEE